MNDDDVRSLLGRSLREGGMDSANPPDEAAITRRVRGARRRRTAAAAVGAAASIALVAVVAWQAGAFDTDPLPPATPTQTGTDPATDEPTDPATTPTSTPTEDGTGEGSEATDWSDAVFPSCGDTGFALPGRSSQLVVEAGPAGSVPPGAAWPTTLRNTGSTTISGSAAIVQTVVVDGGGTVVATVDPDDPVFWGPEGSIEISVAGGQELPFAVQPTFGCDGTQLPAGSYTAFVLVTVGDIGETDPAALEQAQGGPFPFTVDDGAPEPDLGLSPPAGAVELSAACGDAWSEPQVETRFRLELLDSIVSPRAADNDIDGRSRLTTASLLTGTVQNEVLLVADGRVVAESPGTDAAPQVFLGQGSIFELGFFSPLLGCDGQPLPAGDYQAVVLTVLYLPSQGDLQRWAVATVDPVDVTVQ